MTNKEIDVILPVHNEEAGIEKVLTEFYDVTRSQGHSIRFVICEDGSKDRTVPVIQEAAQHIPIHLISEKFRKGYSRAIIDGFKASRSTLVACIDSDGQCDPQDFDRLYQQITTSGVDLVVGYRNPRRDHWIRKLMSGLFGLAYRCYFSVPLKDPSCPFLIIRREALLKILEGNLGILEQGFWWEFNARVSAHKLSVQQIPVHHRHRIAGETQIYKPEKISGIAWAHLRGLAKLSAELKSLKI